MTTNIATAADRKVSLSDLGADDILLIPNTNTPVRFKNLARLSDSQPLKRVLHYRTMNGMPGAVIIGRHDDVTRLREIHVNAVTEQGTVEKVGAKTITIRPFDGSKALVFTRKDTDAGPIYSLKGDTLAF
jgi:hypothetical protein